MSHRILILVAALALSAAAAAQSIVFVDPTFGIDPPSGQCNPVGVPYLTINRAIQCVAASSGAPGLVRCMPGIYSAATNGEAFPIDMRSYVSVESTGGATATTIIGRQTTSYGGPIVFGVLGVFLPDVVGQGSRSVTQEVLVNGSHLNSPDFIETFNAFTLRGGDIQFYIEVEVAFENWAITNCVLDMLHNPPEQPDTGLIGTVAGPKFGVLQVEDFDAPVYRNIATHFLHNTVIMGWQGGPDAGGPTATSLADAIGYCDVTDPLTNPSYPSGLTMEVPTPGVPLLRGVATPNLQNNVIRTLPSQGGVRALLGIDATDTAVAVGGGSRSGPTNAFDQNLVGGANLTYSSAVVGGTPVPWIDVNPNNPAPLPGRPSRDPGFVGEYESRTFGATSLVDARLRDWRLLPDSAYVDAGSAPLPLPTGPTLTAVNGAIYTGPVPGSVGLADPYAWDGEGVGNPRLSVPPTAPTTPSNLVTVDLGFDEAGPFVLARSYANDSRAHNNAVNRTPPPAGIPYPAGVGIGQPWRELIFPGAGQFFIFLGTAPVFSNQGSWNIWPSLGTSFVSGGGPLGLSTFYLPLTALSVGPLPVGTTTYTAPFEMLAHTFGTVSQLNPSTLSLPIYASWQCAYAPATTPVIGFWTNAQSEIF